jgi:hypothetical protein
VLRGCHDDDARLSRAPHFAGGLLDFLLCVNDGVRKYADGGFRNAHANQDFAVILLFADEGNAQRLQFGGRALRPAHPNFGGTSFVKDASRFLRALRHASAQHEDYVGRRERIFLHQPATGAAKREASG